MKKLWKLLFSVVLCLVLSTAVWADEPGQKPDYFTDYFIIVESADGGINIYAEASLDATKLNNELIPNGTALHIEGEKLSKERVWGLVEYHGMRGYVPFDGCRMATEEEAIESEILMGEAKDVDYDVEVDAKKGSTGIYRGPGEKFGVNEDIDAIPNGEKLHISKEIELEDKSNWGLTEVEDSQGWVDLGETKRWRDKENASDMVSMESDVSEAVSLDALTPTPKASATPTPTSVPTEEPTPSVTEEPTPSVTETPTPSPSETLAPSNTPTPEAEATEKPENTPVELNEDSAGQEASSQDVKAASSWIGNPFVWIGLVSCLAVVALLIYHFKKK